MPRGRKINSNGEKSKKLLLEKAIDLFSKNGYHETKISDIVKAANLTQPTFYLYFVNKESLYNDLKLQFKTLFFENVQSLEQGRKGEHVIERIHVCLTNLFKLFLSNPGLTKIGFYQAEESETLKMEFSKLIEKNLNELKDQFAYSDMDMSVLANSTVGTIERVTLTLLFTEEKDAEQLASDIMNIYFIKEKV